ncbi:hypothetical protein C0992_004221 [Termitomyces sp. T32_za158]|nr:hypothetical protein C0992_004221 [Termitomyces sp. T32_za158]
MKLAISATLLTFAGLVASTAVPRQFCPEATRFGTFTVSPNTVNPGDNVTISVNLDCGINQFGIRPKFLDFTIVVPAASNNGFEPPIVLARRDFNSPTGSTSDQFTAKIPLAKFYVAGAPYNILMTNTYPTPGTDGSDVLVQGGIFGGITINV